jgi:hypothetical protein
MESKDAKDDMNSLQDKFLEFGTRVSDIIRSIKEFQNFGKTLEKECLSLTRQLTKFKRSKAKSASRPLSGFAIPTKLSDELYAFLKIQPGTLIARKDVTKLMNTYIVENECRDTKDKRRIIPNAPLQELFCCDEDEHITYFNLQTYMKKHYVK